MIQRRQCIVSYSNIESVIVSSMDAISRKYRLDPSQYNADVEKTLRHCALHNIPLKTLESLGWIEQTFLPNRFSRSYTGDNKQGTIMLGTSSMLDMKLPRDMRIFLNNMKEAEELFIHENDILISRSGTIGTSTICGKTFECCVASDDCIRLRCNTNYVGFVATYLKTNLGLSLLAKDSHGKVIKHLKPEDVRNLKIMVFDDETIKKVNELMLSAKDSFDLARASFDKVEEMLENSLGKLVPPTFSNVSIVPFGSLELTRLDPHMYDPYSNYVSHEIIRSGSYKKLSEVADVLTVARFKRHYLDANNENGVGLYSSSDIVRARLIPSKYISKVLNKKNIKECSVNEGDVLIPCSGAYGGILGKGVMAGKTLAGKPVSQHVLRVVQKETSDITFSFIAAYLCSFTFGYPLITATRFGKDIPELDPNAVRNIPIPNVDEKTQKKIGDEFNKAIEYQELGNALENQAEQIIYEKYASPNI